MPLQECLSDLSRKSDVRHVLQTGEVIEEYPDDTPFPSYLILGFVGDRPFHVVVAVIARRVTL